MNDLEIPETIASEEEWKAFLESSRMRRMRMIQRNRPAPPGGNKLGKRLVEEFGSPIADPVLHYLLRRLKDHLPALQEILEEERGHWAWEDGIYRFYHQSHKVYHLQQSTERMVRALRDILPYQPLNVWFLKIVSEGTGKTFRLEHNERWLEETRPIVEAYFHALYFLEMAVKYGRELEFPPHTMPSGWAAFLYLFNLR